MKKIGLFDSGIGGLSVLKAFIPHFPYVDFVYFADTLNLPYGEKSSKDLKQYCNQIKGFLVSQSVNVIIVACNTASTLYTKNSYYQGIPLFNIITPTVESAVSISSPEDKAGVLATSFTVSSEIYLKFLTEAMPSLKVEMQSAPLLAEMVEENIGSLDKCDSLLEEYLKPLIEKKINTLILGCAHYFFLLDKIKKLLPSVRIIYSGGEELISGVTSCLGDYPLCQNPSISVCVSKNSPHFTSATKKILHPYSFTIQETVLNSKHLIF